MLKSYKNVLCLHHDDMDGYVSGRIVYDEFLHSDVNFTNIECRYNKDELYDALEQCVPAERVDDTLLVVVDYSVDIDLMEELVKSYGVENILWIDHHYTAIEKYNRQYPDSVLFKGIRNIHLSAAELTWLYFNEDAVQNSENCISVHGVEYDLSKESDLKAVIDKLPLGIKFVGEWDTWRHSKLGTTNGPNIALYFKAHKHELDNDRFYAPFIENDAEDEDSFLYEALKEGSIISQYIATENEMFVKKFTFPVKIDGFPDINAVAMNTQKKSSKVFDFIFDNYEVGIVYLFNGRELEYSFYRLGQNPKKIISCGEIAKTFGGGGHMGAAGCTIPVTETIIRRLL